jgi:hypothetical protein
VRHCRLTKATVAIDHPGMSDELDPREAERARRRDREAEAERRALLRPGMGKVFKQIQDAQAKAARETPKRRRGSAP